MKLLTIRTVDEWGILQREGILRTNAALSDPDFCRAYDWMSKQLSTRVGVPSQDVRYPVWVWRYWAGTARARPDLRCGTMLPRGTLGVRLELDLPPESVLLSNFDAWHAVLNDHYHALDDADYEWFEQLAESGQLSAAQLAQIKEQSWQRIFDLSLIPDPSTWSVQGVVWEVPLASVQKVDYFKAR